MLVFAPPRRCVGQIRRPGFFRLRHQKSPSSSRKRALSARSASGPSRQARSSKATVPTHTNHVLIGGRPASAGAEAALPKALADRFPSLSPLLKTRLTTMAKGRPVESVEDRLRKNPGGMGEAVVACKREPRRREHRAQKKGRESYPPARGCDNREKSLESAGARSRGEKPRPVTLFGVAPPQKRSWDTVGRSSDGGTHRGRATCERRRQASRVSLGARWYLSLPPKEIFPLAPSGPRSSSRSRWGRVCACRAEIYKESGAGTTKWHALARGIRRGVLSQSS